jgi:glutathione S-transferase
MTFMCVAALCFEASAIAAGKFLVMGGIAQMAHYRLHCVGASGNSYKVALYLNCAGLDWEPVGVDFAGGETRTANWRAGINAMGEVPVLEVAGRRMSQSGAILLWLAETVGKFAPAEDQRFEALRWLLFDNHRFTNNYAMHRVQNCFTPHAADPAVLAFLRSRVETSFAIADKHLADRRFVLGERPTIVDFSLRVMSITPPRRPASNSRRSIRRSMPGAGALPRCPAGSRPTS